MIHWWFIESSNPWFIDSFQKKHRLDIHLGNHPSFVYRYSMLASNVEEHSITGIVSNVEEHSICASQTGVVWMTHTSDFALWLVNSLGASCSAKVFLDLERSVSLEGVHIHIYTILNNWSHTACDCFTAWACSWCLSTWHKPLPSHYQTTGTANVLRGGKKQWCAGLQEITSIMMASMTLQVWHCKYDTCHDHK